MYSEVIPLYIYIFYTLFSYRLSPNIEQSSLCYTVDPAGYVSDT